MIRAALICLAATLSACAVSDAPATAQTEVDWSYETNVDPNSVAGDYRGVTGTVERITDFETDLVAPRDIEIWLPPSYKNAPERRYPVLYMHDGQNVFDPDGSQYSGWDWGVDAGFSPSADFRPDFSVGAHLGRAIETAGGAVIYPEVTYRYDDYALSNIHNIQPGLTAYLDDGLVLTGRLIATLQSEEPDQLGWLVEGRKSLTEQLQIRAGYANAPEAINGIAITTQSLFGGLTYALNDDLDVHLNLARDDRENSFVRTSGNVGFTYKR